MDFRELEGYPGALKPYPVFTLQIFALTQGRAEWNGQRAEWNGEGADRASSCSVRAISSPASEEGFGKTPKFDA